MLHKCTFRMPDYHIGAYRISCSNVVELHVRERDPGTFTKEFVARRVPDALEVILSYQPASKLRLLQAARFDGFEKISGLEYWRSHLSESVAHDHLSLWTTELEHHLLDKHRPRNLLFGDNPYPDGLYAPQGPWERQDDQEKIIIRARRIFPIPTQYHPPLITLFNGINEHNRAMFRGSTVTAIYETPEHP
jgi:hypothetical protein